MHCEPLKLFVYAEGTDFEVPAEVIDKRGAPLLIPLLQDVDDAGNSRDGSFMRVSTPDAADYIVYPYVLEPFISIQRTLHAHDHLRRLPHFYEHESRHVFFNFHDRGQPLLTTALVITDDPRKSNVDDPNVYCYPHFPAPHVLKAAPNFDFDKILFDVCFTGTLSDPVRVAMVESIANEKRLRSYLRHPNTLDWSDPNTSYLHMKDETKRRKLEAAYISCAVKSWAMLCPRGMGSSSIRFYEALCFGRIPVHISDEYTFPLDDCIDYKRFCIDIRQDDVPVMGKILAAWFRKKDREELAGICRAARAAYEEHLQAAHAQGIAVHILRRFLARRNAQALAEVQQPRYCQVAEALTDALPRMVATSPSHYANLDIDSHEVWLNRGFKLVKSDLDPSGAMTDCNGVSGYLPQQDIEFLLNVAFGLPRGGTLVEIGSWMGLSGITMANALYATRNLDARIFCVDTWLGSPEHQDFDFIKRDEMYEKFLANVRGARADLVIRPVRAPSLEAAARFRDESIDVLFIDGDHSYEACLDDMLHWLPKVRPGGLVVGHDCYAYEDNGVYRATLRFTELTGIPVHIVDGLRIFSLRKPLAARTEASVPLEEQRHPGAAPGAACLSA